MDEKTRKAIYAALCAPFPEACIQRTEGRLTGRGYDTTGIGYQHIVNRLNDVLGIGGFRAHRTVTVKEIKRSNGRPAFEAICDLTLELGHWVDGKFVTFAESLADGGHVASSEADARKGAYTNAFKKAAAFHGVGKAAYEGTLDDDNLPDGDGDPTHPTRDAQDRGGDGCVDCRAAASDAAGQREHGHRRRGSQPPARAQPAVLEAARRHLVHRPQAGGRAGVLPRPDQVPVRLPAGVPEPQPGVRGHHRAQRGCWRN